MTDRRITSDELEVVRWLLANGDTNGASRFRAESLEGAAVFAACSCGCTSLNFLPDEETRGSSIVAEAVAVWPDGVRAGVMLWAQPDRISSIEVYDMHPDASHRQVTADVLRRWEEYYQAGDSAT